MIKEYEKRLKTVELALSFEDGETIQSLKDINHKEQVRDLLIEFINYLKEEEAK